MVSNLAKDISTLSSPLPLDVFYAIAGKVVLTPIETIVMRKVKEDIQILLIKREEDDPFWPGMLHSPGTILQITDTSYHDAFSRIEKKELNQKFIQEPIFVDVEFRHLKRGAENALLFVAEIEKEVPNGKFYSYQNLPNNIIEGQLNMWAKAVAFYKKMKA